MVRLMAVQGVNRGAAGLRSPKRRSLTQRGLSRPVFF